MTRHIRFEGIDNFRDYGGYPTSDGGRLKRGRLFRSANQARATDEDLTRLAELSLSVIVDLRRANERERDPSRRWHGFDADVIENDIGQDQADAWHVFIESSDLSVESFHTYMFDYYRAAPFERRHIDLYARYFQALARSEGPLLVHCTAGKDRTGIICALTHHLAGVHDDDIVEDYLLTNDTARQMARLPIMREAIREATGRVATDEALLTAMRVEAAYLEAAFAAIRETHGSLDGYLDGPLGLTPALRETLRARLVD